MVIGHGPVSSLRLDKVCAHFILVYPWWLQNEPIKTFLWTFKSKNIALLRAVLVFFCKIINFLSVKFNLFLTTQALTKINWVLNMKLRQCKTR